MDHCTLIYPFEERLQFSGAFVELSQLNRAIVSYSFRNAMITAQQTYYCGQKDQHVTLRYLLFEPVNFLYKVNSYQSTYTTVSKVLNSASNQQSFDRNERVAIVYYHLWFEFLNPRIMWEFDFNRKEKIYSHREKKRQKSQIEHNVTYRSCQQFLDGHSLAN